MNGEVAMDVGDDGPDVQRYTTHEGMVIVSSSRWLPRMVHRGLLVVREEPVEMRPMRPTTWKLGLTGPQWAMLLVRELAWQQSKFDGVLLDDQALDSYRSIMSHVTDRAGEVLAGDPELRAALLTLWRATDGGVAAKLLALRPWLECAVLHEGPAL